MSTTQPAETTGQTYATLVRGRIYFLKDKEFLNGVAVAVTAEERQWLEDNAIDLVSVEGEAEYQERSKFSFSASAAPVAERTPARNRARVQAP